MENRLYVTNLGHAASADSLRECFATCGAVSEVKLVTERNAQHSPPSAFITMATSAAAEQAVRRLNGTSLAGRTLMVSLMPEQSAASKRAEERADDRANDRDPAERKAAAKVRPNVALTQQYRERHNMTYELDCLGVRLTVRVFFPAEGAADWRIEARSGVGAEAFVIDKAASTRELALREICEAWQASSAPSAAPSVDWQAVTLALKTVRAV